MSIKETKVGSRPGNASEPGRKKKDEFTIRITEHRLQKESFESSGGLPKEKHGSLRGGKQKKPKQKLVQQGALKPLKKNSSWRGVLA